MCECVLNKTNSYLYIVAEEGKQNLIEEGISLVASNLFRFKPESGKSFSYFTLSVRNLYINLNYKARRRQMLMDECIVNPSSEEDRVEFCDSYTVHSIDSEDTKYKEKMKEIIEYWDINGHEYFRTPVQARIWNVLK